MRGSFFFEVRGALSALLVKVKADVVVGRVCEKVDEGYLSEVTGSSGPFAFVGEVTEFLRGHGDYDFEGFAV